MPSGNAPAKDVAERLAGVVSSPALNTLVGAAGVAMPVIAWASHRAAAADILLAADTLLVLLLVAGHLQLRRTHVFLRRPASRDMSDPRFFDLVRSRLEADLIAGFGEIADGHLLAYAGESTKVLALLLQILAGSPAQPKRALARDLATPQGLHLAGPASPGGHEYLAANRQLIEADGEIRRIFICWAADLLTEQYARDLQELVDHQRSSGVRCGLAVRDRLSAEQAVDFIVIACAAVSVQDDLPTHGRVSVHFKKVDRWVRRHESLWGHGGLSAASALTAYQDITRPMLAFGSWDKEVVRTCLERL